MVVDDVTPHKQYFVLLGAWDEYGGIHDFLLSQSGGWEFKHLYDGEKLKKMPTLALKGRGGITFVTSWSLEKKD